MVAQTGKYEGRDFTRHAVLLPNSILLAFTLLQGTLFILVSILAAAALGANTAGARCGRY